MEDLLVANTGVVVGVASGVAGAALYHLLPVLLRVVWFLVRLHGRLLYYGAYRMDNWFNVMLFGADDWYTKETVDRWYPPRKPKEPPVSERIKELEARAELRLQDCTVLRYGIDRLEARIRRLESLDSNDPDFTQEPGVPYGKAVARPYDDNYAWSKIGDPEACPAVALVRAWNAQCGVRYLWDGSAMWRRGDGKWQESSLTVRSLEVIAQSYPKTDGELSGHEALDLYRDLQRFQTKPYRTATEAALARGWGAASVVKPEWLRAQEEYHMQRSQGKTHNPVTYYEIRYT